MPHTSIPAHGGVPVRRAEEGGLASAALGEMFFSHNPNPKNHSKRLVHSWWIARKFGMSSSRAVCTARSMEMLEPRRRLCKLFLCGKGPVFWSPSLLHRLPLHPD